MVKLDELDVKILELLVRDSRMQYRDMARLLGVSIPTISSRIRKLYELGVIKRFTVLVDKSRLSQTYQAVLLVKSEPSLVNQVAARLNALREVREVYVTGGSYNIVAKIEVARFESLRNLLTEKIASIRGVADTELLIVVETVKEEQLSESLLDEIKPELSITCDFCGAPITGKPVVEYIDGGRYYFSSEACLEAYKRQRSREGRS
jgi:Lrp/AsnC family transcriptional regulator for asnA, asnC and gidA